jgi:hypothetical protein
MVWEEFHIRHLDVLLQAMYFHACAIVDIDLFLLRYGKQLIVVQPSCIPHSLSEL